MYSLQKAKLLASKKEAGNAAYKAGKLQDALNIYGEALEVDINNRKTNAKLRYNRALVSSKVSISCLLLKLILVHHYLLKLILRCAGD